MNEKLLQPYNPKNTEERVYAVWEKSGFFNPDVCIEKGIASRNSQVFSIVLPPPNVTGVLHMGHSVMLALQDAMVRFNRMAGKKTLWVPGVDHAAIATQSVVEKKILKEEDKSRHDLGREEFLRRVDIFTKESHDTIVNQVKRMGASLDWSREAFTLDEKRNRAVRVAFKKMYDDGLIYRGLKIVNWDPKMQTTVSDDEIEWEEETRPFYYLKYGPFTIATARPETKFGDKYVVMHPKDKRYSNYLHGQKIELDWINGPITATVIKDNAIDMEFGTGVMTITPWHDAADFDIAERHQLDKEQIIDDKGKLLPIAGEFAGQHIKKARPMIVEKLQSKGLVEKIDEKYVGRIATNSRSGGIIEPQIKCQWFVAVNKKFKLEHSKIEGLKSGQQVTLRELMKHVVESGEIRIIPEHFQKIYFHWIENLHDWCISRQIWYGHRIPVWYKNEVVGAANASPEDMRVCPPTPLGDDWKQDEDTLDTWFSSGLWTFSTLGWPDETEDLKTYHPTAVLETGQDLIFFWVARMILMTGYLRGEVPFKTVYLHGIVRDKEGKKMSKSKGNGVDPITMIEKYGADAVRMSLIVGWGPGSDMKISEEKLKAYKHFANKLWNIARFVMSNIPEEGVEKPKTVTKENALSLQEFEMLTEEVSLDLREYRFHLASEKLYQYIWHTFADIIIERSKKSITDGSDVEKLSAQWLLYTLLRDCLKLLHPFMPFITEELWSITQKSKLPLMVESWTKKIS
ncbi:MAG: valine--tRNA ligase [Patescibacteria group bacterium]